LTDHAEYFGVMPKLIDPKDPLSKMALGKELSNPTVPATSPKSAVNQILHSILTSTAMSQFVSPDMLKSNWREAVEVITRYNEPGKFTTLIAFEWTSIPGGKNMHRNVFFRDDEGPAVPFSAFDSIYPRDLWTYQEIQRNMGHDNLSIPHNGNVSATYTSDIGDSQLSVVWTDPEFDPSQPAVYYVRVLEIPTPRWTTYDSVRSGFPIPDGIPATLQERAWSSSI
jgi:hypothetical protein